MQSVDHKFGDLPIMVCTITLRPHAHPVPTHDPFTLSSLQVSSDRCHYCGMSGKDLVRHHEDANHFGGYFIVNGNEKVMRMLQVMVMVMVILVVIDGDGDGDGD